MKKLIILFLLSMSFNSFAQKKEIWLFGTKTQIFINKHKLKNTFNIKHYLIDRGREFEARLSIGLSANKDIAMRQMKQRFENNKVKWSLEAKRVWQGSVNAQSIGIEKVPAITFDRGKTVLYGVTDLSQAYQIYLRNKK